MNDKKKVIILALIDLSILIVLAFFQFQIFFILLILNILFLSIVPLLVYSNLLIKQVLKREEYYNLATAGTNCMHMDKDILIKMFEIRISNLRQLLFSYLVFFVTFTLAVASNERIYNYFNTVTFGGATSIIIVGVAGVLFMVYLTFGVDRLALKELEFLLKAKEKLTIETKNDPSSTKIIENK